MYHKPHLEDSFSSFPLLASLLDTSWCLELASLEQLLTVPSSDPSHGSARDSCSDHYALPLWGPPISSHVGKHSHDGSHHHRSSRGDEHIPYKTKGNTLSKKELKKYLQSTQQLAEEALAQGRAGLEAITCSLELAKHASIEAEKVKH